MHQPGPLGCLELQRVHQRIEVPAGPRAALHSQAGRFVDRQDPVVTVEDTRAQCLGLGLRNRGRRRRLGAAGGVGLHKGRNADDLAGRHPSPRLDPASVEPHLAGSQQLFDAAMGEVRQMAGQPSVQPHAVIGRVDTHQFDTGHASPGIGGRRRDTVRAPSCDHRPRSPGPDPDMPIC